MIIVEQGKVVDVCAASGEYTYDTSTEPSLFCGDLSDGIEQVFGSIGKRFTFGGEAPKDQRIYYFNTKELVGNKYGTPSPVPFRVVDANVGLDIDISIRCFGEFSYRITNPILFYTNVCGNVEEAYTRDKIDGQLRTELMTALQPAFAKISEMGIRYSALPGHTTELADALNHDTKELIKREFLKEYHEKSLEKIKVSVLVSACNISRGTFYFYFTDVQRLYKECEQDIIGFMEEGMAARDMSIIKMVRISGTNTFITTRRMYQEN